MTEAHAAQVPPCIHTVETGKHERHQLDSVHQANAPFWFLRCSSCGWIDVEELAEQVRAALAAETVPRSDWRPDDWLEGEIELTAFALANPDCDVRAVLRGFAEWIQSAQKQEKSA